MSDRPYRLCIDPGHGGKDPGAINKELDIQEKKINLAVGLFMRSWKTNAFMSIHTNARPMRGRVGLEIEVYHYPGSEKGKEFATTVKENLVRDVGALSHVIDRGVKEGKYYVLKHTKMPAILVELGFLSDNEEALFLSLIANQEKIAKSLCEAAETYLEGGGHEWTIGEKLP